jgi:plastocyanin domain-containing protein
MLKVIGLSLVFTSASLLAFADAESVSPPAQAVSPAPVSGTVTPAKVKKNKPKKTAAKSRAVARTVALSVTEEGFVPQVTNIKKGEPINLVITRQTDRTCARQIIIPEYGLSKDLPMNEPVTIALTPNKAGRIIYGCSMGMIRGVLSVE